ncbi:MAG TPA: helix-turn-helix domain-containing protein [Acidobacteriota bacterium]|jgi:two-component system response regulator YesN
MVRHAGEREVERIVHRAELKLFGCRFVELQEELKSQEFGTELLRLLSDRFQDPDLTVKAAASTITLSSRKLNSICRRATSFTFRDLLVRVRLLRAIEMIATKDFALKEVAALTGFIAVATLRRNLRRLTGHRPRDFRPAVKAVSQK